MTESLQKIAHAKSKSLPFHKDHDFLTDFPTPFYLYDETAIRKRARELCKTFGGLPTSYRNYFAVKALPNPHILSLLVEEGMGLDCSSYAELVLAERVGVRGQEIMFTSNNTPLHEYRFACELGAIINFDDISHLSYIEPHMPLPDSVCFRYNPGSLRSGNNFIGKPEEAKYGLSTSHIFEAYKSIASAGVKQIGLHTMIVSNELSEDYFIATAEMMFRLAVDIHRRCGVTITFINLGGGMGIPYHPKDKELNLDKITEGISEHYKSIISPTPLHPLPLYTENGRFVTGPFGYLISKVRHLKTTYRNYVGLDASMADLMRPGMYGAYHHITVLGKEEAELSHTYDVTGSLCENNDKFAIQRSLPRIEVGDICVIHDVGAHGRAMGFNYNGKLRPAEYLLREDGSIELIRRAETLADYLSTIEWGRL